jgi:AraC-like DNA-binding protein
VREVFAGNPPLWMPVRNGLKVVVNLIYVALAVRTAFRFGAWRGGAVPMRAVPGATRARAKPGGVVPPPTRGSASGAIPRHRCIWVRAVSIVPVASLIPFAYVAVDSGASARLAAGAALPFTILAAAMAGLIYTFSMLILLAPDVPARVRSQGSMRATAGVAEPRCTDEQSRRLAEKLRAKLVGGAYRDPEVSLHSLAEELHVTPNRLSMVVNQIYGQSFRELLNRCRIDFFVRRVVNGALEDQSILDLAFEAGFSSKSTFNRVFKEHIGMSPSCYAAGIAQRRSSAIVQS